MSFLQSKKETICMCPVRKKSIFQDTFSDIPQTNKTYDFVVLLEFKELYDRFIIFYNFCKKYLDGYSYIIIPALGCTPKNFTTDDTISVYSICKQKHVKSLIEQYKPKVIITVGRALYSITETKEMRPEHFFIPVKGIAQEYQLDDTHIYSSEYKCNVFPIPALYQWIKNSDGHEQARIKDVYEYKFSTEQFERAITSLSERKQRVFKPELILEDDANIFIQTLIDNTEIKAIAIDTESTGLNYFVDDLISIQFSYNGQSGHFCYWKDIDKNLLIQLFARKDINIIMHNCLEGSSKILLANGKTMPIGKIVNKKLPLEIICYDENNKLVKSKIVNWFKNGKTNYWYKIYFDTRQNKGNQENILITGEHEIYTQRGKIKVYDLQETDKLIYNEREISEDSFSFFVGSLLGDGRSMGIYGNIQEKDSFDYIRNPEFSHPHTQKNYLIWKHTFLKNCNFKISNINKNDNCINEDTYFFKFLANTYIMRNFRKKIKTNSDALTNLDLKSFAIWYMDDGTYTEHISKKGIKSYYMSIRCKRFTQEESNLALKILKNLFNINFIYKNGTLSPENILFDRGKNSFEILQKIAPYMNKSMLYKLPQELHFLCETYNWSYETQPLLINIKKIEKITKGSKDFSKIRKFKYDIEVETYHNYIANNIKVSNSQHDLKFLLTKGITNARCDFDTMLAAHSLNENSPNGLKPLTWIYTNYGGYDFELKQFIKQHKIQSFLDLPKQMLLEYSCFDALVTYQLWKYFVHRFELEDISVKDNFYNYIMPAVEMITDVEMTGVQIDMIYLNEYVSKLKEKAQEIEKELHQVAGKIFNIRSTKELSVIIRALPDFKTLTDNEGNDLITKTGNLILDKETIDRYAEESNLPFLKKVSEYNHITKEISQLGYQINQNISSKQSLFNDENENEENEKGFLASMYNGRLYGGYKLHGTETGRMAGGGGLDSTINWQNMPTQKEFRKMFLASNGYVVGASDFDMMEICTCSQLAGTGVLESLILDNKDMHCFTATTLMKLFGINTTYEEVFSKTKIEGKEDKKFKDWRHKSKILNFQGLYGATKYGLASTFGVLLEDGEKYLTAFYEAYPEVKQYMDDYRNHAKQYGYVQTLLGRKRRLPELTYIGKDSYKNKKESSFDIGNLLNSATNAPSQGCSGQTTLIAMTNIWKEFRENKMKSRIIINVHDEIVFELWILEIQQASEIIKKWMEKPYYTNNKDCKVTLTADLKIGEIWKYGFTQQYWNEHPDEWQQCLEENKKRNEKNKQLF